MAKGKKKDSKTGDDGEQMKRLTYKQEAAEANQVGIDLMKENRKLRERIAVMESQPIIVGSSNQNH